MPATVSSNSRLHALRPVTSFSCSSFSRSSASRWGRKTRRSRSQGSHLASAGSASSRSSSASSNRFNWKCKEQQTAADRGHPLVHDPVEAADLRIGGIARNSNEHRTRTCPIPPRSARNRRSRRQAPRPALRRACPVCRGKCTCRCSASTKSAWTAGLSGAGYYHPGPRPATHPHSSGWRRRRQERYRCHCVLARLRLSSM